MSCGSSVESRIPSFDDWRLVFRSASHLLSSSSSRWTTSTRHHHYHLDLVERGSANRHSQGRKEREREWIERQDLRRLSSLSLPFKRGEEATTDTRRKRNDISTSVIAVIVVVGAVVEQQKPWLEQPLADVDQSICTLTRARGRDGGKRICL